MTVYNFLEDTLFHNISVDDDYLSVHLIESEPECTIRCIPLPQHLYYAYALDCAPDLKEHEKHFAKIMHDSEVLSTFWSFEKKHTLVQITYKPL